MKINNQVVGSIVGAEVDDEFVLRCLQPDGSTQYWLVKADRSSAVQLFTWTENSERARCLKIVADAREDGWILSHGADGALRIVHNQIEGVG